MLFEGLLNIIAFILKFAFRAFFALAAIPFGVYIFLQKFFTEFSKHQDFWYWTIFGILTILLYYILWKPILWIAGISTILDVGND